MNYDLINPTLYNALMLRYGDVHVSRPGEEPTRVLRERPDGGTYADYKHGEEFRVNCPYCDPPDVRHHLYFSCYWGTRSEDYPEDGRRLRLAHCFRCNGLDVANQRQELFFQIYSSPFGAGAAAPVIRSGRIPLPRGPVTMPGEIVLLHQLETWHPAYRFIRDRGFDPVEVGTHFNVGLCITPPPSLQMVDGRLIMPVYADGQLAGWQARCVGDFDWRAVSWPKYYNLPGFAKSTFLYNGHVAEQYQLRVVVEGATKVWRFGGGPAVGTFGSSLSPVQASLLAKAQGPIVWLWDGDSWDVGDNNQSKSGAALELLSRYVPQQRIVPIRLPEKTKPTSYERLALWHIVRSALDAAGWKTPLDARAELAVPTLPMRQVPCGPINR